MIQTLHGDQASPLDTGHVTTPATVTRKDREGRADAIGESAKKTRLTKQVAEVSLEPQLHDGAVVEADLHRCHRYFCCVDDGFILGLRSRGSARIVERKGKPIGRRAPRT